MIIKNNQPKGLETAEYLDIARKMLRDDYLDRIEGDTPMLYTKSRVAKKMGIARQTFSKYVTEEGSWPKPELSTFIHYAQAVNMPPSQFFFLMAGMFHQAEELYKLKNNEK